MRVNLLTRGGGFLHPAHTMDRREFVTSFAALGATAALPSAAAAQTEDRTGSGGGSPATPPEALRLATLRRETTRQLTTFNLKGKSKTIPVPRGKRVTFGEVKGQGYIAQFWLTFPGWFWQHWNPKAPINQSILKTLILRIYWDGAEQPAVAAPVGDFFGAGLVRGGQLRLPLFRHLERRLLLQMADAVPEEAFVLNSRTWIRNSIRMSSATCSTS